MALTIQPITGIPEVQPGDDLSQVLEEAIRVGGQSVTDGDVVVITHKIVSKAEGRVVELADDSLGAHRHLIDQEAVSILRRRGDLVIAETRHGFVCANAGVDRSNAGPARAILLPLDPDASANRIRLRLERSFSAEIAVIITDTFGRAWRRGLVDVAIGVAGMAAIHDLRGTTDDHGRPLDVTEVAIADELAAAADLVIGKTSRNPAVIIRGVEWERSGEGIQPLVRPPSEDLFR